MRSRRILAVAIVVSLAVLAGAAIWQASRASTHANLRGTIETCSAMQAAHTPDECAAIKRAPEIFLVGPYDSSGTSTDLVRRQIRGDKSRSFTTRVPPGNYAVWFDLQGVLYTAAGLAREFRVDGNDTRLTIRPGDLFDVAGTVAET